MGLAKSKRERNNKNKKEGPIHSKTQNYDM